MESFAWLQAAVEYEDAHAPDERFVVLAGVSGGSPLLASLVLSAVLTVLGLSEPAHALLRVGDRGPGVRLLQEQLNLRGDGIYGDATAQAVRSFQQRNGLIADGIAGAVTLAALGLPANLSAAGSGDPGNPRPVSGTLVVNVSSLNVRSAPGLNAPVTGVLFQGAPVALNGVTRNRDGYTWVQLVAGSWVANEFLDDRGGSPVPVSGTAYVAAAIGVNVRTAPAGRIVGSRRYGQPLELTGRREFAAGRYWVQIGNGDWVAEEFVDFAAQRVG